MTKFLILLLISLSAMAQSPWYFGSGEAVNLTNGVAYKNGVKIISGSLDPSAVAVNAPAGSMYISTSGTTYIKQDSGSTTNWLPLGIAAAGSLSTINGQSGPNISITDGSSGSDFNVASSSNTITLNLPTASATKRGALSSADWSTFNGKEPAITAGTSSEVWQGDKTWIAKTSLPISTATQSALDLKADSSTVTSALALKQDAATAATDSELSAGLATKEDSISPGTSSQVWQGDKTWVAKTALPISTATQSALDLKADASTAATDSELSAGLATKEDTITLLPLSKGGTNKSITASAGQIVYTDGDSFEVLAAGTSGHILQSNGAAAPSWVASSASKKPCFYKFGGASATLSSPTECTTGTCIEVEDTCGSGSPPAWGTPALYNDLTFAAGTWANSSSLHCSCSAYDASVDNTRECILLFRTSDGTWSTNSSGGVVLNIITFDQLGAGSTSYVSVRCEGTPP